MPIRVKCEQCKKTLSVKDVLAGKRIKCPVCQTALTVPAVAPAGGPADSAGSSPAAQPATPKTTGPTATKKPAVMGKPVAKPAADRSKTNGTSDPKKNGTPVDPTKNGTPAPTTPPDTVDRPPEHAEAEALALFAEALKPKEEDGPPKTIDFTCEHCDMELHLPLAEGGKRMQCPNPECRQLIKVPVPKIEAKKDWRKMDRAGPAAALVNQPEQLEDAWSSQNVSKARQTSLAQAGALEAPPKPKRDATAWLFLVFWSALIVVSAGWLGSAAWDKISSTRQHRDIDELKLLADFNSLKKLENDLLRAEANRVLALLYLREIKGANLSERYIKGATVDIDEKKPSINEQLFLLGKAFALIEQGGEPEETDVLKTRRKWDAISDELATTLGQFKDPELQVLAVREVINRLIQKKKEPLARQLAGNLAGDGDAPVKSQLIALSVLNDEQDAIEEFAQGQPPLNDEQIGDPNVRSGFAEGYARKGEFDKAAKVAMAKGLAKERLEACLGVASIALAANKKDEAIKCVKEALDIANNANEKELSEWNWNILELIKLAARTDELETVKQLAEKLKPEFRSRAYLEIFHAKCEKTTGKIDAAELGDLEVITTKDDFVPLALAWEALARHNTQMGASRNENRKTFDTRIKPMEMPDNIKLQLRQMVDVGTYLGSVK